MAPHARPSGYPTMGGIFNDASSTRTSTAATPPPPPPPHTRPSGYPTMGGIFNDANATQHTPCCHPTAINGLPGGVFRARSLFSFPSGSPHILAARSEGAAWSLALVIGLASVAIIACLVAILCHAIDMRKRAKARHAARRAMHRSGNKSSRAGSHRSSPCPSSIRSSPMSTRSASTHTCTRSTRTTGARRSGVTGRTYNTHFGNVPNMIDNPSPVHMARARSSDFDDAPPTSTPMSMSSSSAASFMGDRKTVRDFY